MRSPRTIYATKREVTQLVVNSSQGGGSKDTWVLAGTGGRDEPLDLTPGHASVARPPSAGPALAQTATAVERQQEMQQQSRADALVGDEGRDRC